MTNPEYELTEEETVAIIKKFGRLPRSSFGPGWLAMIDPPKEVIDFIRMLRGETHEEGSGI